MEGDVSGSFNLSCELCQNPYRQLRPGRHCCRCGRGRLDQNVFTSRKVGSGIRNSPPSFEPVSLLPFHGLSPAIKTLRVEFTLVLSFPLLEDLAVVAHDNGLTDSGNSSDERSITTRPPNPPIFTGSLNLILRGRVKPLARQLLSLPGGIHFRELDLV